MAEWKKVIVSGSNAHLKHITSSGNFSASGNLFGDLTENTNLTRVVVYNPTTGQLEQKELNLVQTIRAPRLFLADLDASDNSSEQRFKLSFDSSSDTSEPITAPYLISASYAPHGLLRTNANTQFLINGAWDNVDADDQVYFDQAGPTNLTGSVNDVRNGLIIGASKEDITIHLNTVKEFEIASVTSGKSFDPVPEHDINAATKNYLVNAFDSPIPSDTGSLEVYVNDTAAPKAVFSLTGSNGNNNITTTVNSITPNIFASQSNFNNFGDRDITKSNRSGSLTIGTGLQVDGYNYAYVLHTGSRGGEGFAHITNFVEWFYDNNGAGQALVASLGEVDSTVTAGTTTTSISGIKYFTSGFKISKRKRFDCTNQYKNVYNNTGGIVLGTDTTNTADKFSVTQSGLFITSVKETEFSSVGSTNTADLQTLQSVLNAHTEQTRVTCSFEFHPGSVTNVHFPSDFLDNDTSNGVPNYPGGSTAADCEASIEFRHINKANTSEITETFNDFLMITQNSGSTSETEIEQFRGEKFRVRDRSYSTGDDPTSYLWDGTQNIGNNGASEYQNGLLLFSSHLVYPTNAGEDGDGGDFTTGLGPTQDNDYSSGATQQATGVRNYIRYFKVPSSGAGNRAAQLEFKGRGKVVRDANTLNGQELKVFLQRLGTSDSDSFFNSGFKNLLDSDCRSGAFITNDTQHIPLTNTLSSISYASSTTEGIDVPTSVVAFSEAAAAPGFLENEHLLVKIECPDGWDGFIDAMSIRFGNFTDSTTSVLNALGSSQQ